ncbi:MAG: hypothetical protein AAFY20_09310 [Cyanobacteria bacterium J06639_14]
MWIANWYQGLGDGKEVIVRIVGEIEVQAEVPETQVSIEITDVAIAVSVPEVEITVVKGDG